MTKRTCKTVGELIDALSQFDVNAPLVGSGPDDGGYDWTWCDGVEVGTKANYYVSGHPEAQTIPDNACMLFSCEDSDGSED